MLSLSNKFCFPLSSLLEVITQWTSRARHALSDADNSNKMSLCYGKLDLQTGQHIIILYLTFILVFMV